MNRCLSYSLIILLNIGLFEGKPTSTDNITVSPNSNTVDLQMYTYVPGTVVTLTCTGNVGNPAVTHRWCKRTVNDGNFVVRFCIVLTNFFANRFAFCITC